MSGPRAQLHRAVVVLVMIGVHAAVNRPRMQHRPALRIPTIELAVDLAIPAAFVAVVPEQNAGMIHVAAHDLADEARARRRVVEALPAGELVEHVQAELIRRFEEMFVGRVVRHAHGIHVRLLDEARVRDSSARASACGRSPARSCDD